MAAVTKISLVIERLLPLHVPEQVILTPRTSGPLVSGFIAEKLSWRWIFWVQVITNGVLITTFAFFFKETRGSILLSRKAQRLNEWYEEREKLGYFGFNMDGVSQSQRIRWKVKTDEERQSLSQMIQISVYRPFHMLTTEPVVFFFSLWVAFAWAVLYLYVVLSLFSDFPFPGS